MASPVAMRMAGELGIDLRQVKGSGPMGRIIKRDIETYIQERDKAPKAAPQPPPMPTPSYEPTGAEYTVEPFTGIRQTIGKRMTESKQTRPALLCHDGHRHGRGHGAAEPAERAAARDRTRSRSTT